MTTSLIHAQHLRPPMAAHAGYPESVAPIAPLWLHCVPDNALLYLSAGVLRVHDTADN